ncbi:GSCOCG00008991001-RA-CDS [Cotesia congregata]|uniref:Large ribosomal subunit protein uL11m n=1 Tax=Cotesia congregata TaxID=51543 RepID=A0A8J2HQE9_COTCN|nr:GSCOCG00008991001-RA-CDS [Cotesia congregata]CAG5108089.1 Similar to mRpL11: 39S ribosomal protein L11 [Cotesia congregata]
MSKVASRLKSAKKLMEKVDHSSKLHTEIPAGLASPSPPLGSQLGQRNINIANFVKEFNQKTEHLKEGIPIPCRVKVNPDRTYDLVMHKPPTSYYLMQAAGIQRGAMNSGKETSGKITLKHLYEIAKIKSEDPPLSLLTLEQITQMFVGIARTIGIQIVRDLDADEYAKFLKEREVIVAEQKKAIQEAKEAKMLRTA